VLIVLLFRHGIWGTGRNVLRRYVLDRRRRTRD
jgi:branched-chain amino acid transport system permease protein